MEGYQRDPTRFKVLVMGEPAVGKTAIIRRWTMQEFSPRYQATIGVDFYAKELQGLVIDLWDISGHPQFEEFRAEYYSNPDVIILVFDIFIRETFDYLDLWVREIQKYGLSLSYIVVCGNKIDQNPKLRRITKNEALSWSESRYYTYYEVSAATGQNVKAMFENILTEYFKLKKSYKIS